MNEEDFAKFTPMGVRKREDNSWHQLVNGVNSSVHDTYARMSFGQGFDNYIRQPGEREFLADSEDKYGQMMLGATFNKRADFIKHIEPYLPENSEVLMNPFVEICDFESFTKAYWVTHRSESEPHALLREYISEVGIHANINIRINSGFEYDYETSCLWVRASLDRDSVLPLTMKMQHYKIPFNPDNLRLFIALNNLNPGPCQTFVGKGSFEGIVSTIKSPSQSLPSNILLKQESKVRRPVMNLRRRGNTFHSTSQMHLSSSNMIFKD